MLQFCQHYRSACRGGIGPRKVQPAAGRRHARIAKTSPPHALVSRSQRAMPTLCLPLSPLCPQPLSSPRPGKPRRSFLHCIARTRPVLSTHSCPSPHLVSPFPRHPLFWPCPQASCPAPSMPSTVAEVGWPGCLFGYVTPPSPSLLTSAFSCQAQATCLCRQDPSQPVSTLPTISAAACELPPGLRDRSHPETSAEALHRSPSDSLFPSVRRKCGRWALPTACHTDGSCPGTPSSLFSLLLLLVFYAWVAKHNPNAKAFKSSRPNTTWVPLPTRAFALGACSEVPSVTGGLRWCNDAASNGHQMGRMPGSLGRGGGRSRPQHPDIG